MRESAAEREQDAQWQAPPASEARLRQVPAVSAAPEAGANDNVDTQLLTDLTRLEDERKLIEEETAEIKLQLADAEQRGNDLLMKLMTDQDKQALDRLQAVNLRLSELKANIEKNRRP